MIRKINLVSDKVDVGSIMLLKSNESLHMNVGVHFLNGWWIWVEGLKEILNGCPSKWLIREPKIRLFVYCHNFLWQCEHVSRAVRDNN